MLFTVSTALYPKVQVRLQNKNPGWGSPSPGATVSFAMS